MRTFARTAACLSLLLVVAGCATDDVADAPSTSGGGTTAVTSPSAPADAIASVALRRSGGLKPVTVRRVYSATGQPPPGSSPADVLAVLDAARGFEAAGASLTPTPATSCCDAYTYRVTITHTDGTSTTYTTVDGLEQPPSFEKLLSALA